MDITGDDCQQDGLWWTRGLTLTERVRSGATAGAADELADRRLDRWRADYPEPELFAVRLAEAGLDEHGLRALLAEPPAALAARVAEPGWVAQVRRVLAAAPVTGSVPEGGWAAGFAAVLAPFTQAAAARLEQATPGLGPLRACFTEQLSTTLVRLARRTLVLELNVMRVTGRLTGATPEQRFADFVRQTAGRAGLTALLTEYAVLARLLDQACAQAVAVWAELLTRFAADRPAIVGELLGGTDPGALAEVTMDAGDRHREGRSVALLRFESGARLVYKPRPPAAHGHFNDAVRWLDSRLPGLGLTTLAVLPRPEYGWVEFAAPAPCAEPAQLDGFYRRLGALLALLHLLGGTDIHCENLIARAGQPVLVDLETLFHPSLTPPGSLDADPALRALDSSVHRIALLPHPVVGEQGTLDVSALGGDRDALLPGEVIDFAEPATDRMLLVRGPAVFPGAANRPRLGGTDAEPADHAEALLAGFRAGYDAIAAAGCELDGLLAGFAEDTTRVVIRSTRQYATLLEESTHPDLLRDALERDRLFDVLWRESADDPLRAPLVARELAQLWAGDVPFFSCRPAARSLDGYPPGQWPHSGLEQARRRLEGLGRTDRFDQEWIIRASLATRRGGGAGPGRLPGPGAATVPAPDRLLAAASGIADRILAAAHDDGRRVNWLGLEPLEDQHWTILPQGAGLTEGYCGTALFLAQLAALTGTQRYAEVARRAVRPVPALLDALAGRPEHLTVVGGGFAGLGGIAYALTRLASLLDDPEPAAWAEQAVRLTSAALDGPIDLLTGSAGALAAMLAVHRASGLPEAWTIAADCAQRLAAQPPVADGGFATGSAGLGWALRRFAAAGGGEPYERLGVRHLRAALQPGDRLGWSDGLVGTALALADGRPPAGELFGEFLTKAVQTVSDHGPLPDHSLRGGESGALELLAMVSPDQSAVRAGLLLATLDRHGPRCGTPDGVSTPGLLTGLSGIGYQLLRLAGPARTPSVLLLHTSC